MTNSNIVELNLENFRPLMLEQSTQTLLVVYFWANWDEASVAQLEVIKQFASTRPNDLVLATVDCDAQAEIVQQFGVRRLPTTMLVKDGQPIDGFSGPQTLEQLITTFEPHLPKPEDDLLNKANEQIAQGDFQQAFSFAKQAHELAPTRADVILSYAHASVETGNLALSKELIAQIGLADQQGDYQVVMGKIELAEKAAESPELLELQAKYEQDPSNVEVALELAVQLQQAHKQEEALALAFATMQKNPSEGEAKKILLDMINSLADGDALKSAYRRKLYSLLY